MPDIILGYQNARLTHYSTSGRLTTINMALTNLNGRQIESIEPIGIEIPTINLETGQTLVARSVYQTIFGYHLSWTLTYSDFASGADLVSLGTMLNGLAAGDTLRFTPRIDDPLRSFDVVLVMSPMNVGIAAGGVNSPFNKDFVIQFKTKDLVRDLGWHTIVDPSLRISAISDGIEIITS